MIKAIPSVLLFLDPCSLPMRHAAPCNDHWLKVESASRRTALSHWKVPSPSWCFSYAFKSYSNILSNQKLWMLSYIVVSVELIYINTNYGLCPVKETRMVAAMKIFSLVCYKYTHTLINTPTHIYIHTVLSFFFPPSLSPSSPLFYIRISVGD